jgi:adenosylcobinamide-GDP ribazoletransferase
VIRAFFAALTFLTILPAPRTKTILPLERISAMLLFFPLIGVILGALLAGGAHLIAGSFTPLTFAVMLTLLWALLTGGLHLDGVADVADALFSSRDRARALEIMKDSRIGAMGAIALFGILSLKVALIAELGARWDAIIAAAVLGRWAMVAAATTSRYARPEGGLGSGLIQSNRTILLGATLWLLLAVAFPDSGRTFLAAWGLSALLTIMARAIFHRRLGGLTGDCVGAINEAAEIAVLMVYCLLR